MPSYASSSSGSGSYDWDEITTVGSNTWTVPSGVKLIYVTLVGGGGGGGGGYYTSSYATDYLNGGSGGAGQILYRFQVPVTPGSALTVVVGVGGTGSLGTGSTNGMTGGTGGITTISNSSGINLVAAGGGGGFQTGNIDGRQGGSSGSGGAGADYVSSTYVPATLGISEFVSVLGDNGFMIASSGGGATANGPNARRSFDPAWGTMPGWWRSGPGLGYILGPSCPAGVDSVLNNATRGKAPGYGGGGGPSTVAGAGATGAGGDGQPGYCLIEWGL